VIYLAIYLWMATATYLAVIMQEKDSEKHEKVVIVVFWPLLIPAFVVMKLLD